MRFNSPTIDFYEQQAQELIVRYDNANMSELHQLLLRYIQKDSQLLDIGFGSGRDLDYLHQYKCNIWGIDPTLAFVKFAQKRFPSNAKQFLQTKLPFDPKIFNGEQFDIIISIAVWMHIQRADYKESVASITAISKDDTHIIISYSKGKRDVDDGRYFEDVDLNYLTCLFKSSGFRLIHTSSNKDSLNRDSLEWITVVFLHD